MIQIYENDYQFPKKSGVIFEKDSFNLSVAISLSLRDLNYTHVLKTLLLRELCQIFDIGHGLIKSYLFLDTE